jgi:anti-sigma regulatory factor (Ser/Thr protein kinase)
MAADQATMAAASVTYPGTPASVPVARRWLRRVLSWSPRVDDLELIVSELMSNAIRHTPSGHDGGTVAVTIRWSPGAARIELEDDGTGQWSTAPHDAFAECGRGLMLVSALADDIGHDITRGQHHRVWAEVTWPPA